MNSEKKKIISKRYNKNLNFIVRHKQSISNKSKKSIKCNNNCRILQKEVIILVMRTIIE